LKKAEERWDVINVDIEDDIATANNNNNNDNKRRKVSASPQGSNNNNSSNSDGEFGDDDEIEEFVSVQRRSINSNKRGSPGSSINNTSASVYRPMQRITQTVLPKKKTELLLARIKKLVSMWADEEQMKGINNVANKVPTSIDQLASCDLSQNFIQQYGERLIKNINAFIEQENLQTYIQREV